MADSGWTNKLGATPGKLGVVALLAIVLVGVVLINVSGSSAPANTSQGLSDVRQKPRLPERVSPSASAAQTATPPLDKPPWTKVPLEEAIQHDPFALVGALAQWAAVRASESNSTKAPHGQPDDRHQRISQAIAALRNKGVQMVLLGEDEKLAIIGDRPVRVGDVLEGLQVIAITPRGITLSEQGDRRQ